MSDTSDSEVDTGSKSKGKHSTIFDNDIFDAEESDDKNKTVRRNIKTNQEPAAPVKKSILKTNNEQTKKVHSAKIADEATTSKPKVVSVPKTVEKKKTMLDSSKLALKGTKTSGSAQKRPSTDDSNESAKKLKIDDGKAARKSIDERTAAVAKADTEVSASEKPSIVITTASNESPATPVKTVEPAKEAPSGASPQTTPTKFGIVFASHHRQSSSTPPASAARAPSTETLKNDREEMDHDHEPTAASSTVDVTVKNEPIAPNISTLKPPALSAPPALSDDETLNPETMQLSDLIGASRREGTKPTQSRSAAKASAKGKRTAKQDPPSSKRQPTKTTPKAARTVSSAEKGSEPVVPALKTPPLASNEQASLSVTHVKRLSTTESSIVSSPISAKEAKRLRTSVDESPTPIKVESNDKLPAWTSTKTKAEPIVATTPNVPTIEKVSSVPMETETVPSPSPIIASTHSLPSTTTTTETENTIRAVYPSMPIPPTSLSIAAPSISKLPSLEKTSPIIAPISKETLPIVEHQSASASSTLPTHGPIKPPLTSNAFSTSCETRSSTMTSRLSSFLDENVEETLSAVNSLLMLNNNPSNLPGDHAGGKGAARVAPTISKPVYSFVASLPSPTNQQSRPTPASTSVSTPVPQQTDLITLVSNIVSSSSLTGDKPSTPGLLSASSPAVPAAVTTTTTTAATTTIAAANTATRSHIEEVIDDVAKGGSTSAAATATATEPTVPLVDTTSVASSSAGTTKSTPIPNILRDVMKTPCLASSTAATTPTTATTTSVAASETLNIFDSHRRSSSPLKTITTTPTVTTSVSTATTSSVPVVPALVRPTLTKTSSTHKRSATPKTELPTPAVVASSAMIHPFSHMVTPDGSFLAANSAGVHHPNFPFPLFAPLPSSSITSTSHASSNLLAPSHVSSSPPMSIRTTSTNNNSSSTGAHMLPNPFLNTIMSGQQNPLPMNANPHTHEKGPRR